jgi:hypothetical protein
MQLVPPSAPLKTFAQIYRVSQSTLHRWSHQRGILRDDLASPEKVLEKLQHSATKDAPTLWHLRQPEVQARIKNELAALNPKL